MRSLVTAGDPSGALKHACIYEAVLEALTLLESGRPKEAAAIWDSLTRTRPSDVAANQAITRFFTFQNTLLATALCRGARS
jgi:hypothetical protein